MVNKSTRIPSVAEDAKDWIVPMSVIIVLKIEPTRWVS